MVEEDAKNLVTLAVDFQTRSARARERCREEHRRAEKESENTLRLVIDGLMSMIAGRISQKIENISPEISYQIGLSASYIRTHFIVFDLVMEGCIIEAMVLMRNQLESIARLNELDSKPLHKLEGKVPNIQNVLNKQSGKIYGHLSEVAHFSKPGVSELMHVVEQGDGRIGPSLYPIYHERNFASSDLNCFLAVYFLAWIIAKLSAWYPDSDNKKEQELFVRCLRLARECDVIRFPEESGKQAATGGQAVAP